MSKIWQETFPPQCTLHLAGKPIQGDLANSDAYNWDGFEHNQCDCKLLSIVSRLQLLAWSLLHLNKPVIGIVSWSSELGILARWMWELDRILWLQEKEGTLPEEPQPGAECTTCLVRFPDGARHARRFRYASKHVCKDCKYCHQHMTALWSYSLKLASERIDFHKDYGRLAMLAHCAYVRGSNLIIKASKPVSTELSVHSLMTKAIQTSQGSQTINAYHPDSDRQKPTFTNSRLVHTAYKCLAVPSLLKPVQKLLCFKDNSIYGRSS